jgi:hypothetical protein
MNRALPRDRPYPAKGAATPSPARRFFLYDPEEAGMEFFATREARDARAAYLIGEYCDYEDGWSELVTDVVAGEVTHVAKERDVILRSEQIFDPEDNEGAQLDPNDSDCAGIDGEGRSWPHSCDRICNYALTPIDEVGG